MPEILNKKESKSMVTYVSGIPPVNYDHRTIIDLLDGDGVRTALHIHTDPVTGVACFSVYFDDGHGNGNCILSLPVAELRKVSERLSEQPLYA